MNKIPTIFNRDWEGNRSVINESIIKIPDGAIATEKVDGTNVRLTVRSYKLVRLEKRRNPTKRQKVEKIITPWYVDSDEYSPGDKYVWEAARNTDLSEVPDGEWSGEALGPKIQGNSLNLKEHKVFLFSLAEEREKVKFNDAPLDYDGLRKWLPEQKSKFGNNCGIEGLVWWNEFSDNQPCGKIKLKDFK